MPDPELANLSRVHFLQAASSMDQSQNARIEDALPLCIEDKDNAAFICTRYDPSSRRRHAIVANSRWAAFFQMHCEEMLARAAVCELPPPFIEWDALLLCLHMSVAEHFKCSRVSELYQRMWSAARSWCQGEWRRSRTTWVGSSRCGGRTAHICRGRESDMKMRSDRVSR